MSTARLAFLVALVMGGIFTRLLPHPPNFTAIGATAVFAGALLDRRWALWASLAAMVISDAIIGFHGLAWAVYLCVAFSAWLGSAIQSRFSFPAIVGTSAVSALIFFFGTNLAVWAFEGMYPLTGEGLVACYIAALPFLGNMILGDVLFAALLYFSLRLGERYSPALRPLAAF